MGNFLLGFAIGAAIGVAIVVVGAPRSGSDTRRGINELVNTTLEVARRATSAREKELWADFRGRLPAKPQ
jgi:gas vesicle protein